MTERRIAIILETDGRATVAAFDDATGAVERLENATQVLNQQAANSSNAARKVSRDWQESGKAIGQGVSAAVSFVGLLVGSQIRLADSVDDAARRIAVSTEFYSEMAYAANMASVETDVLETSLGRLAVNAAKAEAGSKSQIALFRSIGVSVEDSNGKLKTLEQLLPEIADKFKEMPAGPRETALAVGMFSREGRKLIPLLDLGAEGLARWRAEAIALGRSIDTETAAAAAEFSDDLDRLQATLAGTGMVMARDVLPPLQQLTTVLLEDAQAASTAGQQYSVLGNVVKILGSIYYVAVAIIETGTTKIAAAIEIATTLIGSAAQQAQTFLLGATAAQHALLTGDARGAVDAVSTMIDTMQAQQAQAARSVGASWDAASGSMAQSLAKARTNLEALWAPTEKAGEAARAAGGDADALGEGFLGAGRKARQGADDAARAMERLRELVRQQQAETMSEVGKAGLDYAGTQEDIAKLERQTAVLAGTAEREQLLAQARSASAAAHEKALRIAQLADAQRERERDIVGRTLDDLRQEVTLVGATAKEREILRLTLEAENRARQRAAQYGDRSAELTAEEVAQIRAKADALIDARKAAEELQQIREGQQDEIDQLRAAVKNRGELSALARAELAIRKALLGVSEAEVAKRKEELDAIRAQAREIDTLNAQRGLQDIFRGIFGNTLDAIQQGRSPWEAFRTEGVRALADIAREIVKVTKGSGDWREKLKRVGDTVKALLPEIAEVAGTVVGGGGQGAALGAQIGGAIGSMFGPIGSVVGALIGGWAGGTFDDDPEIRVGPTVSKPEQTRTSRFATFQVRTESMTDPTSATVADAIVEFDALIYDMMTTGQRAAARAALTGWSADKPVLSDLLKERMRTVLGSLPDLIGDFVLDSSTDLQRQIQNLSEVLALQQLETDGDLLTGTLERALELIVAFGRAGETAGQTYSRLAGIATQYGTMMTDVQQRITMAGLNDRQRQQVQIELEYRAQIRQANELARAMGLSGARAEDLARIEQLRAINMAEVQRQIEAERQRILSDLSLSDLSPLRDDQKLGESMRQLRAAVAAGDLNRAEELSQTALGFGRNLFASGADYNALYAEVTGLLRQVSDIQVQGLGDTQLDTIADLLTELPEQIARALFDQLYATIPPQVNTPPPSTPPPSTPPPNNPRRPPGFNAPDEWTEEVVDRLGAIAIATQRSADASAVLADGERRRQLIALGEDR